MALKSPLILLFSVGLNTFDWDLNQYKVIVLLFGSAYAAPNKGRTFYTNFLVLIPPYTVELRWLDLVGTVDASSTPPCVRAIPSLTIFKLIHVYFMPSRTAHFFDQICKAHVTPVTDQ